MNIQFKSASKTFLLSIFWLVFPPLFLLFSFLWKTPKMIVRILLTVFAPLSLIFFILVTIQTYQYYYFHFERGSRTELEAKAGLKFPNYKTIEKRHFTLEPSFNGDFTMEYTIQLDTLHIQDFYSQIDHQIKEVENEKKKETTIYWSIGKDGNYSFSHFDPKDEDDQTLSMEIDKKTAQIKISYGRM